MKIKYSSITKFLIGILVLMHLCFFLIPLSGTAMFSTSYISKTRMFLFLVLMAFSVIFSIVYTRSDADRVAKFEMLPLGVCCVRAIVGALQTGNAWDDTLAMVWPYLYMIIAIPLINIFCANKWKPKKAAKFLVIATSIDTLIKAFMSFYESKTGVMLWPNLVSGEMGYRNGLHRINPSALSILVIPLSFWLISKATSKREKLTYIITILIDFLYAYIIWQARSALLYKTIIIIMMLFLQQTNDKKKIVMAFMLMVGAVVLINTPTFNSFIDSFSESNKMYGDSTVARINAYAYYGAMYSKSPFWGIGRLTTSERYALGGGMLEDIGFFYGLVQFGIPMVSFYIFMFFRGIYVSIKLRRKNMADSLLCLSMTLLFIMFGVNMDPFYAFALALPFYMAFVEFVRWNNVKNNKWDKRNICQKWRKR